MCSGCRRWRAARAMSSRRLPRGSSEGFSTQAWRANRDRGRAMRVTVLIVGSRGDVQPLLALGLGLARAGHEVRVAAFPGFEQQVNAVGLEFAPLAEGRSSRGG